MSRILWLTETDEGRTVIAACAGPDDVAVYGPIKTDLRVTEPDLIIVVGWRRLLPKTFLEIPRRGVVGFHSAKLPEYPGRAPVPWTLVRGDRQAWTTMFYLDEGIDSGDIIDMASVGIDPNVATVESVYRALAQLDIELLRLHLDGLLAGTAPRLPQSMVGPRGPLTTKDGWDRLREREAERDRMLAGHA